MAAGDGRGAVGGRVIAEAALIVASVLLALAVDEWREGRAVAARVETALTAFEQELEANLARVRGQLPYHVTLRTRFGELVERQGPSPRSLPEVFQAIPEWQGIGVPGLLDVAWQAALASDVVPHMDFELTTALARVYRVQEALEQRAMQGATALDPQNLSPETLPYTIQSTSLFIQDMVGMEGSLYCLYIEGLHALEQARGLRSADAEAWAEGRRDTLGTSPVTGEPVTMGC